MACSAFGERKIAGPAFFCSGRIGNSQQLFFKEIGLFQIVRMVGMRNAMHWNTQVIDNIRIQVNSVFCLLCVDLMWVSGTA